MKNLGSSFSRTKVTTIIMIMAKRNYTSLLNLSNAPPNYLIWTIIEKVGIIPKEMLHISKELVLILLRPMRRNLISDKIINNISKPWQTEKQKTNDQQEMIQ